jgi:hypothetical protein
MVLGVRLGECPFCGGEVDDEIVTFGGSCPKCFAEIPGEEAATDPGEEVKEAIARADERRSMLRNMVPFILATPILMLLGCGAIWFSFLRPVPEVALMDFDEFDGYTMPDVVAVADDEPELTPVAASDGKPRPRSGADAAKNLAKGSDVTFESGKTDLGGNGSAPTDRGPRGTRGGLDGPADNVAIGAGVDGRAATGGGLDLNVSVGASRRGGVLTDPAQIKTMIFKLMSAQMPRLNGCYEQELKRDESVSGKWRLRYTILEDGKVKDVAVTGLDMKVESFEGCMEREIGKWRFQRLAAPQPVQKSVTFRPRH